MTIEYWILTHLFSHYLTVSAIPQFNLIHCWLLIADCWWCYRSHIANGYVHLNTSTSFPTSFSLSFSLSFSPSFTCSSSLLFSSVFIPVYLPFISSHSFHSIFISICVEHQTCVLPIEFDMAPRSMGRLSCTVRASCTRHIWAY